jgi:hypothetical protein
VAWQRHHKVFQEIKVHVVSLVLSLVLKTIFGMCLAHLGCLKSVKYEMTGNFQGPTQGLISCSKKTFCSLKTSFWKKLSNKFKNGLKKIST